MNKAAAHNASPTTYLLCFFFFFGLDSIMNFSGGVLTVYGPNETASIFATYPLEHMTLGRSFLDQVTQPINLCNALSSKQPL